MKNYQLYKIFPSPVFHYSLENKQELNIELKDYILNLKKKNEKGLKKSNQGGWHSPMFDILNDHLAKKFTIIFENYVKKSVEEIGWNYDSDRVKIEAMWSIINKKGSFNIQHNHPNAYLSAAYYVKFPEKSGNIKFFDPREQKNIRYPKITKYTEISAPIVEITPKEGDLLIFPAYLYHAVSENLAEEDRIIVSFNVDIKYR
tara:strand:- start:236 stop:841 length:606 start_codon:yes stop_codon:yes gene_type:complete